jgi:hypothetical protein
VLRRNLKKIDIGRKVLHSFTLGHLITYYWWPGEADDLRRFISKTEADDEHRANDAADG